MKCSLRSQANGSHDRLSPNRYRDDQLISVPIASAMLGISVNTLRQWLSQRKIAFVKMGRRTLLKRHDIQAFIDANTHDAIEF